MEITEIECYPISIPWKRTRHIQGREVTGSESVLLKLHTDAGVTGIGETGGTALPYTGDTQESIIGFLCETAPHTLIGADPNHINRLIADLDGAAKYSDQALALVDCALYDLVGKARDVPVYDLLGGCANESLELGWVIGYGTFDTPGEAAEIAADVRGAGYTSAKLKVGRDSLAEDLANLEAVREAVGPDFRIGIDANGTWSYFEALRALRRMEQYDVLLCEQPIPWGEIENLARLRQQVDIPICADESATKLSDVLRLIRQDAADSLFLKLTKVGGIRKAQKWTALAEAAGLPVMTGSMVGSAFETAWQAHFLFANEWMAELEQENVGNLVVHDQYETVDSPITDDLGKNPEVPKVEDGRMYPPEGPGLGCELDEDLLEEYVTDGKEPVTIG